MIGFSQAQGVSFFKHLCVPPKISRSKPLFVTQSNSISLQSTLRFIISTCRIIVTAGRRRKRSWCVLFARVANARAYHNQAAAAAFMYVFKCVSLFLIPQLDTLVYMCAPKSQFRRRGPQSEPEWPRYSSLSLSLYYVGSGAARTKRRRWCHGPAMPSHKTHYSPQIFYLASLAASYILLLFISQIHFCSLRQVQRTIPLWRRKLRIFTRLE